MTLQAHQEIQPAVYGHCDTRFQHLAAALSKEIGSGGELGAAISVDGDGEAVVDIWGGHTDRGQTKKWSGGAMVHVWSIEDCSTRSHPSRGAGPSSVRTASKTSRFVTSWATRPGCLGGKRHSRP